MNDTTSLIPGVSVETMLQKRSDALARLEIANNAVREASALFASMLGPGDFDALTGTTYDGVFLQCVIRKPKIGRAAHAITGDDGWLAKVAKDIDRRVWADLVSKSGLMSFMDAEARSSFSKSLQENVPPLTFENIRATFAQIYEARGEMFERGVLDVFHKLTWSYKTNRSSCLGKRIIMTYFINGGYVGKPTCDPLEDLDRVFHVLDGKPEPDHRVALGRSVQAAHFRGERSLLTDFFKIKWFKNGNAHVEFTRPDLVDQLNKILVKHHPDALPASPTSERR